MGSNKEKVNPLAASLAIFFSVLVPTICYVWPKPFHYVDWGIYDYKLSLKGPAELHPGIVHLDVDDKAVSRFGLWPWDRQISAQIVSRLSELGAKVIVFDILFTTTGKSQEGNEALFKAISAAGNVVSASTFGVTEHQDRVIQIEGDQGRAKAYYIKAWRVKVPREFKFFQVSRTSDVLLPLPPIIENSKFISHIRSAADRDGVHRRTPVVVGLSDRIIPSLSLAALVAYLKSGPEMVKIHRDGRLSVAHEGGTLDIPLDSDGTMLIDWQQNWNDFPRFSASCLFDEKSEAVRNKSFKDKIVIIGHSTTGTTEIGVNPFSNRCVLSRVHSSVLNAMLTGSFVTRFPGYAYFPIFAAVVSVLFALAAIRLRLLHGILFGIGMSVLYIVIVFVLFTQCSLDVPLFVPLLVFVSSTMSTLTYRGIALERKARQVAHDLGRYLSPETLASITAQGNDIRTLPGRKELTILFTDIEGFSTISETVDVEYLREFLNDFFEATTRSLSD